MQRERIIPALREYSFLECPTAKLAACCQYEYLRSSQLILEAVARFRAGETDPLAKTVALLFTPDIFWALGSSWWPSHPYLDAEEARGLSAVQKEERQKRNLAHLVNPWPHLSEPNDARRIVAVYIFPGLPLPKLKKAFGDYLQRDYHELLGKPARTKWPRRKPGGGSPSAQCRTDLKALSAWRLQKKFGYTARGAIKLMRELDIYQDERAFRRAVKRVTQKIAALEEELKQLAGEGDRINH